MISTLGPYAPFILGSYGLVAFVVLGLIANIVIDYRRQQSALKNLESSGVTRRSSMAQREPA
jgi:heme exporter protein D